MTETMYAHMNILIKNNNKFLKGCREKEPSHAAGGNVS
jgi:hypothetical protein